MIKCITNFQCFELLITGLDACFIGVPLDAGTTNRSGTRMGPRQIRTESVLVRRFNNATGKRLNTFRYFHQFLFDSNKIQHYTSCSGVKSE